MGRTLVPARLAGDSVPHAGTSVLPIAGLSTLEKPYVEVGAGLSNLLRVIRVDFTWRLTHRTETSRNFRVTVGFDVQF